ncbi:MAG: DUF6600 domain-containing protein [Vulcanimicrobiaceae bacterium]
MAIGAGARADDDPAAPGVARISVLSGGVDVQRGDSGDTVAAGINAPLMVGDYLFTEDGAHAEVQFDYATMLRLGASTQIRFTQLDPASHALQLAQGTVELRVLRSTRANPEIDTPSVAIRPSASGRYRITVGDDGNTAITVRAGRAAIVMPQATQYLVPGNTMVVQGSAAEPDFQYVTTVAYDGFDRWNDDRDRQLADASSYRYVNDGIVGADDLGQYGQWVDAPGYGQVWAPTGTPTGWAPYTDGRWVWEGYYGWTWVSYEPWGWAPYHYGRWFFANGVGWVWAPGPVYVRPVWQPALVAFFTIGGGGFSAGFGNIGWVPLAPFEPFHPWWGPRFVNRTVIVNNITNVTNIYKNAQVPGAVSAVARRGFGTGEARRVSVQPGALRTAQVVTAAVPVVPTRRSLGYSNRTTPNALHPTAATEHRFRAFPAPKTPPTSFVEQRRKVESITHAAPERFGPRPVRTARPLGGLHSPPPATDVHERTAAKPGERSTKRPVKRRGSTPSPR